MAARFPCKFPVQRMGQESYLIQSNEFLILRQLSKNECLVIIPEILLSIVVTRVCT